LNGNYEIFTYENTEQVLDKNVLAVYDKVKYNIGSCYSNTNALASALRMRGIEVKTYVGWIFTNNYQFPVHHCWAVVNGNSVLDLSDDFTVMLSGANGEHFEGKSITETRELIADFQLAASRLPNSVRCNPVGTPTPFLLYVGCECEPEQGKVIYRDLIRRFPNHECQRNCDSSGLNATQRVMRKYGLI